MINSSMNGCRWELKLDGKNIDLGTGSDQELDLALKSKLKDLEFLVKKGTFSANDAAAILETNDVLMNLVKKHFRP